MIGRRLLSFGVFTYFAVTFPHRQMNERTVWTLFLRRVESISWLIYTDHRCRQYWKETFFLFCIDNGLSKFKCCVVNAKEQAMNIANQSKVGWLTIVDSLKREIESLSIQTMAVLFIASKKHHELVISLSSYIHIYIYSKKFNSKWNFLSIFLCRTIYWCVCISNPPTLHGQACEGAPVVLQI